MLLALLFEEMTAGDAAVSTGRDPPGGRPRPRGAVSGAVRPPGPRGWVSDAVGRGVCCCCCCWAVVVADDAALAGVDDVAMFGACGSGGPLSPLGLPVDSGSSDLAL